jgi:hypothetical protein
MTPSGMIDVVELMMGDQIGILSAHQQESAPGTEPMYPLLNGPAGTLAEIKNSLGWPADGYTFDNNFIRQTFTEIDDNAADYNNPKSYKTFSQPIIWMPRFYTPWTPPVAYQSPSQYATYLNGVAKPLADLGGPTETTFSGPYTDVDFGGNIGQVPYYLQTYNYNPGFSAMETNCYVTGFGRVRWQLFGVVNGVYILKQTSLYNSSVAGPCPKLAFV